MSRFLRYAFLIALFLLVVSGIIVIRGLSEPSPSLARPSTVAP